MSHLLRLLTGGALSALLVASTAAAQDRPSEEEIFGPPSPPVETAPTTPQPPEAAPPEPGRSEPGAAERGAAERIAERLASTAETMRIGGQLYLRAFTYGRRGDGADEWAFTSPSLLDLFLDARPNDRVRAFVLARAQFDPTVDEGATSTVSPSPGGEIDPSQPLPIPGFESAKRTQVLLDQAWLRFDAAQRVFFTVGKQHVKWGVGRFWNPTDFLHVSPRNPLATFDARTGTTMVRVHVPWEERGWNLYGAAILEPLLPARDVSAPASNQLGSVGGAARAEIVLGTAEVGADAVVQKGRPARFGLDVSAGIWELDVYGELALRTETERRHWREVNPSLPLLGGRFAADDPSGLDAAATAGASWSWKYSDEDVLTLGGEYAWERNGYDDRALYPWLLFQGDFTPFRLGRHYAGVFATMPAPGSWNDTTFTLSTLGNLSDSSFVSRLDWSVLVLTYLRVEAFGAVHYGASGGEFRFAVDVPPLAIGNGQFTPAVRIGAPTVDFGAALRVSL
ncbi:MAG TPA: hypothetical protein VFK85_11855 [Anaeromyxobacteraceae bacterium]|nr:hypothetical protein [Anaeromyxobacteraceae bacterium]